MTQQEKEFYGAWDNPIMRGYKSMTRNEAVEKIREEYADPNRLIRALEAFGLIKFEEKENKKPIDVIEICLKNNYNSARIIYELKCNGYEIIKI